MKFSTNNQHMIQFDCIKTFLDDRPRYIACAIIACAMDLVGWFAGYVAHGGEGTIPPWFLHHHALRLEVRRVS